MKLSLLILGLLIISPTTFAGDNETTLLEVTGGPIGLPLEIFRTRSEQERILTRKDQILRQHAGGVGMSIRRIMTPVRNQGARGTCNVFAAMALLEVFTGEDYSEQCLARLSSERDPGRVEQRLEWVKHNGVYLEKDCPYDNTQRDKIPDLNHAERKRFDSEFEVFPFTEDDPIAFLKSRLAVSAAVAIEFFVVGRDQWRTGPFLYIPDALTIAKECGFEQSCAGHAVVVTGVNDTLKVIEFKNSWGPYWGKSGYGYLSYDYYLTFGKGVLVSY